MGVKCENCGCDAKDHFENLDEEFPQILIYCEIEWYCSDECHKEKNEEN